MAVPAHANCKLCSSFKDEEYGFQKIGCENENTYVPAARTKLKQIAELKPGRRPSEYLEQCPECKTYYLYKCA